MTDYDTLHNTDPHRWPLYTNDELEQIRRLESEGLISTPYANHLRDLHREQERTGYWLIAWIAIATVGMVLWGMW